MLSDSWSKKLMQITILFDGNGQNRKEIAIHSLISKDKSVNCRMCLNLYLEPNTFNSYEMLATG
jgi:hypothetical protein